MPASNTDILRLTCGSLEADIAPRAGGSLARFNAGQQALMRPCPDEGSSDPLTMACYPLLPFIGRIGLGQFRFEGRDITLPPHPISPPHALHGIGWQRPWRVVAASASDAIIALSHDNAAETGWPWSFEARQHFALDAHALTITLKIENKSPDAMPAGLGLHPFFEGRQTARLAGDLPYIWESAPDGLPTHRTDVTAVRNFTRGRRVAPLTLDHCFSGGVGPLHIQWEDRALGLRIHGRDVGHTVIYTPQAHDFFCVEPVSHVPNAVNRPEPAEITGLHILQPGEAMQLTCRFEVVGLA